MSIDDRQRLGAFLEQLRALLESVVHQPVGLVVVELRVPMANAWAGVHERLTSQAVAHALQLTDEPSVGTDLDAELATRGLTGAELEFKIAGFERAHQRFRDAEERVGQDGRRRRRLRPFLRKALDWADIILSSLPLPFADPLAEFKDGVIAGMEEPRLPPGKSKS